jgi:DNA-binding transcriptional MerR regulator
MKDLERATGTGRETIRYYIREGLLPEPSRPGRNVAWYDETFVERILLIKRLQQERYLPLSVIKGIVGAERPPSAAEARVLQELDGALVPSTESGRLRRPETLSRLARRLGLPVTEVRELARLGAVEIVTRQGRQWLEGISVAIAEEWARLRAEGFSRELGFGPDDVALHVQVVRWLAREETRRFAARLAGKVDPETSRRMAAEGIAVGNRILALLREATLLRYVAEGNVPASDGDGTGNVLGA